MKVMVSYYETYEFTGGVIANDSDFTTDFDTFLQAYAWH
jgi:hypothetical protein